MPRLPGSKQLTQEGHISTSQGMTYSTFPLGLDAANLSEKPRPALPKQPALAGRESKKNAGSFMTRHEIKKSKSCGGLLNIY